MSTAQLLFGVIERFQLQLQFLRLPLSILRINTWSLFIKLIQHKYGIHYKNYEIRSSIVSQQTKQFKCLNGV